MITRTLYAISDFLTNTGLILIDLAHVISRFVHELDKAASTAASFRERQA